MKEYTITRYSFEDLSPEAQEKALENWRHDLYLTLPDYLMEESMLEELAREITGAYVCYSCGHLCDPGRHGWESEE